MGRKDEEERKQVQEGGNPDVIVVEDTEEKHQTDLVTIVEKQTKQEHEEVLGEMPERISESTVGIIRWIAASLKHDRSWKGRVTG